MSVIISPFLTPLPLPSAVRPFAGVECDVAQIAGAANINEEGMIMNISARNVFEGTVTEIKEGTTTAHVIVDVKGLHFTASITNEAVESLHLHVGGKVKVVIKSSDVMVATD